VQHLRQQCGQPAEVDGPILTQQPVGQLCPIEHDGARCDDEARGEREQHQLVRAKRQGRVEGDGAKRDSAQEAASTVARAVPATTGKARPAGSARSSGSAATAAAANSAAAAGCGTSNRAIGSAAADNVTRTRPRGSPLGKPSARTRSRAWCTSTRVGTNVVSSHATPASPTSARDVHGPRARTAATSRVSPTASTMTAQLPVPRKHTPPS
jgi:hypothetical protein